MKYSLLVNTHDSFEDCWNPFFKLFVIYWPDFNGKIYLNTDRKEFNYKNLNIISIKNGIEDDVNKTPTWSECLIRALNSIDTDIVLYMQEDYFLKAKVKNTVVENYVDLMIENEDIDCIHLTDQALASSLANSGYEGIFPAILKQRYRVSCQAALWRKDVLLSYLRSYESAWEFEEFGSKRGKYLRHNFYVVDKNSVILNKFEIIPYIFTGIVRGRWYDQVIPLFKKHHINLDYSIRGFMNEAPKKSLLNKVLFRINRIPIFIKYYYEVILFKFHENILKN